MAYASITIEGGLFPADLLDRIAAGAEDPRKPVDFGLEPGRRLTDEIQSAFSDVRAHWDSYQRRLAHSPTSMTTVTRGFAENLFHRLGFELVPQGAGPRIGNDTFSFSHRGGQNDDAPPIHVVGPEQPLDRRSANSRRSPHSLIQEYLNRSDVLWGIATNGDRLRLLRDSTRVSRPTFVEFDLRSMMEGNRYSEFVLLYHLLHRSGLPRDAAAGHECSVERFYQAGVEQGGRVREKLREGVEAALRELGDAFLCHDRSTGLQDQVRSGRLNDFNYYRQLLRLVYRLLFLFVAEERRLLFPDDASAAHEVYSRYYSVTRLRDRCEHYFGDDHDSDLWRSLCLTFRALREERPAALLGLSPLNGELFGESGLADLEDANCENSRLLRAIYHLSTFEDEGLRRRINYAALDVEELGSVYEGLLEYKPQLRPDGQPRFGLVIGNERRETGSYYTPPDLVQELIEHALVPVMHERVTESRTVADKERALLGLRVCDPASGSGHFLLAAARRIARELAKLRSGEDEPSPEAFRVAVRDVIRNCIYAVDKNPLAVDLCKVALWIEGHNAGLPLTFLDHHVKWGDSLVGVADLKVLEAGIPNEAYKRSKPSQKAVATELRKRNQEELKGQLPLGMPAADDHLLNLALKSEEVQKVADDSVSRVAEKAALYETNRGSGTAWWTEATACNLWTAPFFGDFSKGTALTPTTGTLRKFLMSPGTGYPPLIGDVWQVGLEHRFFHWPIEFPGVMLNGGFDVILGNPPFMGGKKISGQLGDAYRNYLAMTYAPTGGVADLCAYVYRRSFGLVREGGQLGMIATNSICQGDTREGGLALILRERGVLTAAHRFVKWPGAVSVEVNLIALRKGEWDGSRYLDGSLVPFISSRLDAEPETEPQRLLSNNDQAFQGSVVLGLGFMLNPGEALPLLAGHPSYREVLFPYLNGEDLNSRPDQSPSRWVINFFNRSLAEAQAFPGLLDIVSVNVKPERDQLVNGNASARDYARRWWQFGRPCPGLYAAITPLGRVLVRAQVSEQHAMAFVPQGQVYSMMLVVFAFDDDFHFALLQSNIHEAWVRRNASTMRTDIRYTPTDCFETFAFPQNPTGATVAAADLVGAGYHEHRRQTMLDRNLGLTKTYNLFNNPSNQDADIAKLRDLHAEMDRAILACYGWGDLDPGHDFHQNERGHIRFTISPGARREILRRLLDLNLQVAVQEAAAVPAKPPSGRRG